MRTSDEKELRQEKHKTACGGIFVRKECWKLSYKGWGLGLGFVILLLLVLRGTVYGFLALSEPIQSDCVVVEGWLAPNYMAKAAQFIQTQKIHRVFTTGSSADDEWDTFRGETYAELGKTRLASLGVPKEEIIAVPSHVSQRDRTYNSALALKEWCSQNGNTLASFNLLSEGPHARRSYMLFQRALGPKTEIGIIALKSVDDERMNWWQTSAGFRSVTGECVAYLYAAIIFHPPRNK
ncbi:MAG: YdcF family protein [Limisphaerales bacterium]